MVADSLRIEAMRNWAQGYSFGLRISERGTVISVGDGIAWISGLPDASMDEIISLEDGSEALVFHLSSDRIGAILLRQSEDLAAGTTARLSGKRLSIGVGDSLLGRIVDPLGNPLDELDPPETASFRQIDVSSPSIMERDFVDRPLYSGNRIIDALIPIGMGQRQLLVGDNGTGKSSLALDMVLNQKGRNVRCIQVLIGQKRSAVASVVETLKQSGALEYTTVVVAEATAMPGLKYLAPFCGAAIAEHWMWEGHDTLVVYDDLTTHARTYRELSLLLRRPPGREAYPGDIFHLHARLLERSTCLAPHLGGGSMTAIPIVETEQGEIASYIPTNLISITDGQFYLDAQLFSRGFLPAIDIRKSVSRIGGKAQHPAVKREAGRMKLDYLQFLELEVFTRFGSKLEASMEERIRRGRILRELLKQERLSPISIEKQMAWLVAYNESFFSSEDREVLSSELRKIESCSCELTLSDSRESWRDALKKAHGQAS